MIAIALTIAPIFLLIMTGYAFKRTGFFCDDFWRSAERLSYYVLLPVLIVRNLGGADLSNVDLGAFAVVLLLLATAMGLLILALKPLLPMGGAAYTSVFQGAVRLNSYVGFAVSEAVFGTEGLVIASLFVGIMIPTVNVIAIIVMSFVVPAEGRPRLAQRPTGNRAQSNHPGLSARRADQHGVLASARLAAGNHVDPGRARPYR